MAVTTIPGATASTYTLVTADIGEQISVKVTATNVAGSANATSALTAPIAGSGLVGWSRVPLGPGGFISGIDTHTDGTKICRMDTSGVYMWQPGATKWEMGLTTAALPSNLTNPGYGTNPGAFEVAIAPSNSSRIYVAWQHLAEYHVLRSNDRGLTFTATNFWAQNPTATFDSNDQSYRGFGKKMEVDPIDPNTVFLCSKLGTHYTIDGGANWTLISTSQIPAATNQTQLVAIDPNSTTTGGRKQGIYVASWGNGLYKTTNGGATWALAGAGGPTTFSDLKIAPNGTVWALKNPTAVDMNLYKLVGSTWTTVSSGTMGLGGGSGGGFLLVGVAIDPTDSNHIVTTSEFGSLSSTYNGGTTWTDYGVRHTDWTPIIWLNSIYGGGGDYGLGAGASLIFDKSASNTLILGCGLGVVRGSGPPSSASGLSYTQQWDGGFSVGLEQLCAKRLIKPSGNANVILSVMDQGIFSCNGVSHPTYKGVMPYFSAGWDCDSCPADPLTVIVLMNEKASFGGPEDQSGISRDGGGTWTPWYGLSLAAPYHMPYGAGDHVGGMIACGATRDNFVICTLKCNPHFTTNGGAAWTQCTFPADFPTTGGDRGWSTNSYDARHYFCGDRVTANTFYTRNGWSQKFYKSTDAGANWTALPDPSVSGISGIGTGANGRLQTVPGNAGHLTYTMGSSGTTNGAGRTGYGPFIRSTTGGSSWVALGTTSSGPWEVLCVGFGKNAPGQTYPAVYIVGWVNNVYGVWRSIDQFVTWVQIGDYPMGCFDTPVDICGDPDVYGTCYLSSAASGIFKYSP